VDLNSGSNTDWFGGTSSGEIEIGTASTSGTVNLLSANQIRDTNIIRFVDGTFSLGGHDETIRGLEGSAGTVTGGGRLTLSTDANTYTFAGAIEDGDTATGLTVEGSGELALSSASGLTYSGDTLIQGAATLAIDGTLGNSSVDIVNGTLVASAATLSNVDLRSDGVWTVNIGSTSAASFTWEDGAAMNFTLGETASASDTSLLGVSDLSSTAGNTLSVSVDPGSVIPDAGASYPLIAFSGSNNTTATQYQVQPGGVLADRSADIRIESNTVWLDVGPLDPIFGDRFEAVLR
jgi:hypothetical protein